MSICLRVGNVLDAKAEALIMTIDGAKKGLEGNLARAFSRRWPEAFEEIEDQVKYPVSLGRVVPTRPESVCAFPLVLMAATLHHVDVLSESQKSAVVATALREALTIVVRSQARSVATAVLTGGWRLSKEKAIRTMLETYRAFDRADAPLQLSIYVLNENDSRLLNAIAKQMNIQFVA